MTPISTTYHVRLRYKLEAYHKDVPYPNVTQARASVRYWRSRNYRTQIIKRTVAEETIS